MYADLASLKLSHIFHRFRLCDTFWIAIYFIVLLTNYTNKLMLPNYTHIKRWEFLSYLVAMPIKRSQYRPVTDDCRSLNSNNTRAKVVCVKRQIVYHAAFTTQARMCLYTVTWFGTVYWDQSAYKERSTITSLRAEREHLLCHVKNFLTGFTYN